MNRDDQEFIQNDAEWLRIVARDIAPNADLASTLILSTFSFGRKVLNNKRDDG